MAAVGESGASSGSDDPYARLGLAPGASFDEVQAARSRCLAETDNDPQAKARVEAAYGAGAKRLEIRPNLEIHPGM